LTYLRRLKGRRLEWGNIVEKDGIII